MNPKTFTHRLGEILVILAISIVLLGKIYFSLDNPYLFLAIYGSVITIVTLTTFVIAFKFYKDPYNIALEANRTTKVRSKNYLVSCMVAVKNEEENIAKCIDSMLAQTYQNKEIIVVNDGSTDKTQQILEKYERRGLIRLVSLEKNVGKKRALGRAMGLAKGQIFAHTDSDSLWAKDAIRKIVTIFEHDPEVGAVSGHGRAVNRHQNLLTKIQDSWMEGQFSIRKAFESVFGAVTCVSGPLAVFRKDAVFNLIPAWENDQFLGQEFKFATDRTMTGLVLGNKKFSKSVRRKFRNSEFIKKANYPGKDWKVVYSKAAKSWTIVPDTFPRLIKQQVRWKKSFIRNIFFTGLFYWQRPLPAAIVYYLHILFVLVGPFVAFRHLVYLPLTGNYYSAIVYISGIIFIGFMFGIACKLEDKKNSDWIYRPIMSLFSTLVISWLIFYSALTIKKMVWSRS